MRDRDTHDERATPEIEVTDAEDEVTFPDDETVSTAETDRSAGATAKKGKASATSPSLTEDEIQALRAERDRLYDSWMRLSADFENYRKRVERDRQEFRDYALESLLRQLVPVLDNFDRAIEALPPDSPKGVVDGINLIRKQLHDLLAKQGLTPIHASGETFDPHLHEAVATETRTDAPHHKILDEMLRGYKLGKRVLRPAMVKVSVKPQDTGPDDEDTIEVDEDLP